MRRFTALLAATVMALPLSGCDLLFENPQATSMPSGYVGFRMTDGKLAIWTGSPCIGTTSVNLKFRPFGGGTVELQLYTPTYGRGLTPGVQFEYLTLGGPYPGFEVTEQLPADFDWRTAQELVFDVGGPVAARGTNQDVTRIVAEITAKSEEHPEDTFWFPEAGWLSPAEVAQKDGKDFLAMCTPDPKKEESHQRVFGVRVTDGALRLWTGRRCLGVNGVMVTFQPQADLVLAGKSEGVEYLTIGGPYPNFTVANPLPSDFDWRRASSVLLRIVSDDGAPTRTTDLAVPIAESAQHPPDTYYFEGVGWLNPVEVVAGDGKDFTTVCAP